MRFRPLVVLAVFASLLLTACSSAPEPDASAPSVSIPSTPAGDAAQSVIDILDSDEESTVEEWESLLAEDFLAAVSAQEVTDLVNTNLRPARPFTITDYRGTETQATVTLAGKIGEPFAMSLTLGSDGKFTGLLFAPASESEWEEPASLDEVSERLQELPGELSALVIRDGETLIELGADESAPLGSIFKLYVLLAVGEAVENGTLSWDDELTVTDELRSLPSGDLQDEPAGTTVSVQEAALKMISISDNTATDMLLESVGRDAVERVVETTGHHDPAAMRPFLSTRALFELEWGGAGYRDRWVAGDEAERLEVLTELESAPIDVDVMDVVGDPAWSDGLDWFASASDIVAAHQALQDLDSPEIDAIMSENPGVDPGDWPYAAFKGGSSLGVLTGSWFLEDGDRTASVVFLFRGDDTEAVASGSQELFGLAQSAIKLMH